MDPCDSCVCDEGVAQCVRQERCPKECDHGIVRPGECCSDCSSRWILYTLRNESKSVLTAIEINQNIETHSHSPTKLINLFVTKDVFFIIFVLLLFVLILTTDVKKISYFMIL